MNNHEVPFYYGSLANNITKGLITKWINNLWEESNLPAYTRIVSRRSRSQPPHAYQEDLCPWCGQWIRLLDLVIPDLCSFLKFPTMINNEALFQHHIIPLETEYSSSTTASTTAYCRLGWMWPFPCRRSAVYYLEHQGSHWICFHGAEKQGIQAQIPQKVIYQQQRCMSLRSTWQRRVSPGFTGVCSRVQVFWYRHS